MDHFYIYYFRKGIWYYDRTMPTEQYAKDRVKDLKYRIGIEDAIYTCNELKKDSFLLKR